MSFTVDANLLIYAADSLSPRKQQAEQALLEFAAGPDLLYLFWPAVMAYLRVATHPGVFTDPLTPEEARGNIRELAARRHVRMEGELEGFWEHFERACSSQVVRGNLVPDAHLVALMRQHGVGTIWTSDRDFRRFEGITVRDPFA